MAENEIDEIGKLLTEKWGYEKHEGQVMSNIPDISVHHFISKDEKHIIQVVLQEADKETIACIRGDEISEKVTVIDELDESCIDYGVRKNSNVGED